MGKKQHTNVTPRSACLSFDSSICCWFVCLVWFVCLGKVTMVSLRPHGDGYNKLSLIDTEMKKSFSSNGKYKPYGCVYHNNNPTPQIKNQKQKNLATHSSRYRLFRQEVYPTNIHSVTAICVPAEYIRRLRYCDYLGKYFCDCCHSYAQSSIPARILMKWDFKKYYVCNFSKHLLDSIWQQPIFNVLTINKALYTKTKEMDRVRVSVPVIFCLFLYLWLCGFWRRALWDRLSFAV